MVHGVVGSAAAASSSSSSDDEDDEANDSDDSGNLGSQESIEAAVCWVAVACARVARLRPAANAWAVEWMKCACDLAHHQSPLSSSRPPPLRLVGGEIWGGMELSASLSDIGEGAAVLGDRLHAAQLDLSAVLMLVEEEQEAIMQYLRAEAVALALQRPHMALLAVTKAGDLAQLLQLDDCALHTSQLALSHARRALPGLFSPTRPGEHGGRLQEWCVFRNIKNLALGEEAAASWPDVSVQALQVLKQVQQALLVRQSVLQKRNLFNQCGQAAQGSDLSGQDGEDVAGRLSCSGGVDSKLLSGTEKSRRKEQERNNGVTVSPNGEALLQTMLDRTLLLEASDLILSLSRGQPHDTPAWQFLARPHLEDGAEGGDEDGEREAWLASDPRAHAARETLCMTLMNVSRYPDALYHLGILVKCSAARALRTCQEAAAMGDVHQHDLEHEHEHVGCPNPRMSVREERICLYRVFEGMGLCLLNTYQHRLAATAFEVCLYLSRGGGVGGGKEAGLRELGEALENAGGSWCQEDRKWAVLQELVGVQDVGMIAGVEEGGSGTGNIGGRLWVDRLEMEGLEAEALGHKGHALYRRVE